MNRAHLRRVAAVIAVTWGLVACGDEEQQTTTTLGDIPETVAIGVLPEPLSDSAALPTPPPAPTTTSAQTTTSLPGSGPIEGPIGGEVDGDRVILIGDSILAATAPRNDGLMCDALALFGWEAEIDAEPGRDVEFAREVLDDRLRPDDGIDWDVVAFSFGSEVDGSDVDALAAFEADLTDLIERVAPRPTILFTLVEIADGRAEINDVIRSRRQSHPNVVVVEFADAGDDGVEVVDDAGRALTDDGMKRLSIRTAAAMGKAPGDSDGRCLPSEYVDDSDS